MLLLQCVLCLWQVFSFWEVVMFPSIMCQCRPTGRAAMLFLGETATEQLGRSAQPCIFPALAAETRQHHTQSLPQGEAKSSQEPRVLDPQQAKTPTHHPHLNLHENKSSC